MIVYGAESWTLTKTLEKRLDGVYTRMLRTALDIPWKRHVTNKELYGDLPKLSTILKEGRLRFISHVWRKMMKQHKSCCYGNQHMERGNKADKDTPMLTN